ncbi:SDR family NAD(P)-dependent oxidoreductase [Solihabitans fulvus]|uniref:SDR family NAD(P)-dependent oxidoreductase n=1 Tax=Solihabitans fulvus TaxID=1892852 RepID=A0A5B2XDX8_9PSEU|nr:SDR family NAD(P)-dependent oxidoreductase [Solihabitans fulvus]KAA2261200.1 SDR family NAD(P)-dependent oxidoreductase [Solihabitans fulvus]
MGNLDGKVAIVTGAGRGIGREEALLLAGEGARVVVNDLGGGTTGEGADVRPAEEVVAEIAAAGGVAVASGADVSSWAGARELVRQAVDTFGGLDVLVNNAGILRDAMSFNLTEADWDAVIAVHLKGHFAPSRFAAEYWRARHKGGERGAWRIINTTSDSGLFGNPGQSNYAAAKAGIASLTLVLARELARYGVTVNAITPRARTRLTATLGLGQEPPDEGFDPLSPKHVAPVVGWLATDAAGGVSGQVLIVNGTEVIVLGDYPVAGSVDNGGGAPWTVDELVAGQATLFAERDPGVPPLAPPGWSPALPDRS